MLSGRCNDATNIEPQFNILQKSAAVNECIIVLIQIYAVAANVRNFPRLLILKAKRRETRTKLKFTKNRRFANDDLISIARNHRSFLHNRKKREAFTIRMCKWRKRVTTKRQMLNVFTLINNSIILIYYWKMMFALRLQRF